MTIAEENADGLVLEMPVEDYETDLPKKAQDKVPFEGFSKYKCSPWLIKKVPTEKIEINIPPVSKNTDKRSIVQLIIPPVIMRSITLMAGWED